MEKKVMLIILDGWGLGKTPAVDALKQADTPMMDEMIEAYPNTTLVTFGEEVGLPKGQMGNSEVGHLNLGAGRIVYQELTRISKSLKDKELNHNEVLITGIEEAKKRNCPFHLMGLISDGGVHSHIDHLIGMSHIIADAGVREIFIHGFTDGRDVDPKSGIGYLNDITARLPKEAKVVSIVGRYYAMDRDRRWDRTKLAYDLLLHGKGEGTPDFQSSMKTLYENDITDEFLPPMYLSGAGGNSVGRIQPNDVVCFFNFRTDRPRQLTEVLTQRNMPDEDMNCTPLFFLTMTNYNESYKGLHVIFSKANIDQTIGEVISANNGTQIRIAETEKYPHVTFFFNGGREAKFVGEDRILVPSPKVATYDLQPEMSAPEVTEKIESAIQKKAPNFICLNFANTDMVGHTGDMKAAQIAAETVDQCLRSLIPKALEKDYQIIIIADHGNADIMSNLDGSPNTAHTTNLVPCIFVSNEANNYKIRPGKLADVAPTLLSLLDLKIPSEMTGEILLSKI